MRLNVHVSRLIESILPPLVVFGIVIAIWQPASWRFI